MPANRKPNRKAGREFRSVAASVRCGGRIDLPILNRRSERGIESVFAGTRCHGRSRTDECLALTVAAWIAPGIKKHLDCKRSRRLRTQSADDVRGANRRAGNHREVLQIVRTRVGIASVIRSYAISSFIGSTHEINSQSSIRVDRVLADQIINIAGAADSDAVTAVAGDDICSGEVLRWRQLRSRIMSIRCGRAGLNGATA